jgi:predicted N-acetyltransferase YhbS
MDKLKPVNPQAATVEDIEQVAFTIHDLSRWLKTKGIAQWSGTFPRDILEKEVAHGELFVLRDSAKIIASVALSKDAGELWDEPHENALYLHRLAIARENHGQKLGESMMAWAEDEAQRREVIALRLVCDANNPFLEAYYKRLGYQLRGTQFFAPWKMTFTKFEKLI